MERAGCKVAVELGNVGDAVAAADGFAVLAGCMNPQNGAADAVECLVEARLLKEETLISTESVHNHNATRGVP